MEVNKFQLLYVTYDRNESDVEIPCIEPYLIEMDCSIGITVRDLVKMGIPGLKALISVMKWHPLDEYDCANSIVYELMMNVEDIYKQCEVYQYPELLSILHELYNTMPGRGQAFDMCFWVDDDNEAVPLYDFMCCDEPIECEEYLTSIIHNIRTKPIFVFCVESNGYSTQDGIDGTCGVVPGMKVAIVRKENQGTDKFDLGIVDIVLTKSMTHHRGIKVKLRDGKIGRVQKIFC